jgi:hypothetical protein
MTNHVAEAADDAAARSLAEAEKLLGISGPKYTITVDGYLYRLLPQPEQQPAKAAALFSEMLYLIRHWLGEHPEAAAEMAEYGLPMDDETRALPFPTLMSIALGVSLEVYAHKHGGSELVEHGD